MYSDQRAYQLLSEWLSEEQLHSLSERGYFTVRAPRRGLRRRRYRIYKSYSYNVRQVILGLTFFPGYCTYVREYGGSMLPVYDNMLAQAIWLTSGKEGHLREIACRG